MVENLCRRRRLERASLIFEHLRGAAQRQPPSGYLITGMPDPSVGASVTVTVEIDANPDLVYGLITDLPTLASLAEEVVAMQLRKSDDVRKGSGVCPVATNGGRWTRHAPCRRRSVGFRFRCTVSIIAFHANSHGASSPPTRLSGYRAPGAGEAPLVPAAVAGWPPASRIRASVSTGTFDAPLQRLKDRARRRVADAGEGTLMASRVP